jgi:hypothetical protein
MWCDGNRTQLVIKFIKNGDRSHQSSDYQKFASAIARLLQMNSFKIAKVLAEAELRLLYRCRFVLEVKDFLDAGRPKE